MVLDPAEPALLSHPNTTAAGRGLGQGTSLPTSARLRTGPGSRVPKRWQKARESWPTTATMGVLSPPCLLGDQKSPRSQNMKSMVTRPAAVLSPVKQLHLPRVLPQPRPTEPETGRGAQRSASQRVLQGVSRMLKDRCPQHASPEQGMERPRPAVLPAEQCVRRTRVFLGPGGAEPSSNLDRSHRKCHLRKINFYHI